MHIILGATGHVGSAVAHALLDRREPVTVVVRDPEKAAVLRQRGAQVAIADVHDPEGLRAVFKTGQRLFLLNPPAPPSSDTDVEERSTLRAILAALAGSGLQKIVAESTYGAQSGTGIGDAGVLYELEQALERQSIPATVLRGAYYMSNWDALLEPARNGQLESFYPVDFVLPMVAPHDLGQEAARLLLEPIEHRARHSLEGPARHCTRDVAAAFERALGRPVRAEEIPPERWPAALHELGFSEPAARSFAGMTNAALEGQFPGIDEVMRGTTTLQHYINELVKRAPVPS